ncbi:hypothetical protein FACS1894155_05020 [Bacteroidia bacterium]|nr:hypothetical protein FACS1894155_05020 [Bacteroidia bacterium]
MSEMLSIKELNEVLHNLQNGKETPINGTFSEVDIVFIAGLCLWYKKNNTIPKIDCSNLKIEKQPNDKEDRSWIHQHYFKQIKELYDIDYWKIFHKFPNASSKNASTYSNSFAPPIYITKDNIDCFFSDKPNDKIKKRKDEYIETLKKLKESSKSNDEENTYFKSKNNIIQKLITSAPIYTFIFSVAYHKINPFVHTSDKGFNSPTVVVNQIWQFTQEYVRGLYELAKNITEHSTTKEGMITIRAYPKDEIDDSRVLETYVFDFGETGIIPHFYEYTKTKSADSDIKNTTIKKVYENDCEKLKQDDFNLKNLIAPEKGKELEQQTYRHIRHYGINNIRCLAVDKFDGQIYISTNGKKHKRESWKIDSMRKSETESEIRMEEIDEDTANKETLCIGTSYHLSIPFDYKKFRAIEVSLPIKEMQTLGNEKGLTNLVSKNIKRISLEQLDNEDIATENILFDISFNQQINKENANDIYQYFNILERLSNNNIVAINLQYETKNVISEGSDLLRFLSYLTFFSQSFIIYGVDYKIYNAMRQDNTDFLNTRATNSEAYWHRENAMLLFVKLIDRQLYFADLLFGDTKNEFMYVNKILNNTFPNTITITEEEEKKFDKNERTKFEETIKSNHNLNYFLQSNSLLPYDSLLNNEEKPLYTYNLQTILQRPLIKTNTNNESQQATFDRVKALENYIDNFDGYCIPDTHFKIGNKLHSEYFYYAKRLFQNSFYTVRIAMHLAIEIKNELQKAEHNNINKITLVGYEMYSELLLSLIQKFLKEFGKETIHFIAQDEDDKLHFKSEKVCNAFIDNGIYKEENHITVVIVPIASTGSTAVKIVETIKGKIVALEKGKIGLEPAKQEAKKIKYFSVSYNVLWAKPQTVENNPDSIDSEEDITIDTESLSAIGQRAIIELPAKWNKLENCPLCFDENQRKPLYETDKSSLTPAIIFDFPKGKDKPNNKEKEPEGINFDKVAFSDSLDYKDTYRNGEFRLYSIDTENFIIENESEIEKWLKSTVKQSLELRKEQSLKLQPADKIIIVAPCNESNSRFVNMVNEFVFNSSATIIHYQPEVDFPDNFKILYEPYLKDAKIFYVDDSVISGKHFFEIYDLIRNTLGEKRTPFIASIVLKDKTLPYVHNRVVLWSRIYFAFVNINLPPNRSLSNNQPLMHEQKRYKLLSEKFALHDVLIKTFDRKAKGLDYENENKKNVHNANKTDEQKKREEEENQLKKDKRKHHLWQFKATHKIYEYAQRIFDNNLLRDRVIQIIQNKAEIKDAVLKVLCQYPFILYQPLREETFKWNNNLLKTINIDSRDFKYGEFQDFKFYVRRASLLNDYQILEKPFFEKVLILFSLINNAISREESIIKKEDMEDFPIFLARNYIELIQKNGWVAVKLKNVLNELKDEFFPADNANIYAKQFYRMLQIELATVIDDFVKKIEKEERFQWRDMYQFTLETKHESNKVKNPEKLVIDTSYIKDFFDYEEYKKKFVQNINKYEIVKTILDLSENWYAKDNDSNQEFKNYLWIKQLLYADCDKESHLPKEIGYQEKINAIIEKMKGFFQKGIDVQAFFVVTDRQEQPYSLYQDNYVLNDFENDFLMSKELKDSIKQKWSERTQERDKLKELVGLARNAKFRHLFDFLEGQPDKQGIATITIAEYTKVKDGEDNWNDLYNKDDKKIVAIKYLPNDKWLLLIRISQFDNDKFNTMGILGFYGENDLSEDKPDNLLPKQLLMLLRRDIGEFIKKHHKNDEFSALRQAEIAKRFAYLAGHGRQTMQRLAKKDNAFRTVIGTMDKLQYLYATKNSHINRLDSKHNQYTYRIEDSIQNELMKSFRPSKIEEETLRNITKNYIKKIYQSKNIENEVKIKMYDKEDDLNYDYDTLGKVSVAISDNFKFNQEILLFIIFEMIINAKKNRWHCINSNNERCELCKNFIYINVTKETTSNKLTIEIKTTGTKIGNYLNSDGKERSIRDTINGGNPIKESSQNEGIYLITKILEHLNNGNKIKMGESEEITKSDVCNFKDCTNPCEHQCKLYVNTVTITIKEQGE